MTALLMTAVLAPFHEAWAAGGSTDDTVLSATIKEADGTTGQNTNTGSGIKTAHIQDGAVTPSKLAPSAVTAAAIADGAVTDAKIAGSISTSKLNVGTTAGTVAAGDHVHDGLYQKKYANVAIVAKSGGDYATASAAISDHSAWCPEPSAANPCLVKIMPGRYVDPIYVWVPYLDVEGSGPHSTIIATQVGESPTVSLLSNTELRSLTVEGVAFGVSVYAWAQSVSLRDVVVLSSSGSTSIAVYLNNASQVTLDRVKLISTASSGTASGIVAYGGSSTITDSSITATATGGADAVAIYNEGAGSVTIRNTTAESSGGRAQYAFGNVALETTSGITVAVTNSQFVVPPGIGVAVAASDGSSVRAEGCQVTGGQTAAYAPSGALFFGATKFDGGLPTGNVKCASSYNGSYIPTDGSCQW